MKAIWFSMDERMYMQKDQFKNFCEKKEVMDGCIFFAADHFYQKRKEKANDMNDNMVIMFKWI